MWHSLIIYMTPNQLYIYMRNSLIKTHNIATLIDYKTKNHPESTSTSTSTQDTHWLWDLTPPYFYMRHLLITRHEASMNLLLDVTHIDYDTWHHPNCTSTWDTHWLTLWVLCWHIRICHFVATPLSAVLTYNPTGVYALWERRGVGAFFALWEPKG